MKSRLTAPLLVLALLVGSWSFAAAAAPPPVPGAIEPDGTIGRTPLRLSYVDGEVSFWRPGASDWAPAQVNTALVPGDETYTGNRGNLELQIGARAFVRAWGDTRLGLVNQEPDFVQLKVTAGHVSLDLRAVEPGRTVEVDTPAAAFTIDAPGYYRVDVTPERTAFVTRRSGRATMTRADGQPVAIAASEEVVLDAAATPAVQSFVAPPLDAWDTWNYARTDELLDSLSARYVSAGVYGVDDLDHYGAWRVVPTYGPVWVPRDVATGWAPYSTGRWVADPRYGWTWVDAAPWGWAPYHYGRWVSIDGDWAWAPGPLVTRPVYAPALVAFFGAPGVRVTVGVPAVSWVALGWGEPVVPWWGSPRFVGRPWWAGWGGPRVVNNVVIQRTTVVNVNTINVYRNAGVSHAVVAVREGAFGRRAVQEARVADLDVRRLEPVRGRLRVAPEPSSFVAAAGPAVRPPAAALQSPVVATRRPVGRTERPEVRRARVEAAVPAPEPRIVPAPATTAPTPPRAPLGSSTVERERPSAPPRFATPRAEPPRAESRVEAPRVEAPRPEPRAEAPRREVRPEAARPRPLPGEPANRVAPWRRDSAAPRATAPAASVTTPAPAARPAAPAPAIERERPERGKARPATARDDRPGRGRDR
ncbi:MAG TPA: DUF6600 domain-containing protein [Methylomirabilota bacterium]|nr:DUF6600 domain-containing protein [Methylomirabilota bacterium]